MTAPETMTDQPRWLAAAWRELGQTERAGAADNVRIVGYFRDAGHGHVTDDETAWCAAFLGAILERSDLRSTRSLRARSYLDWGTPLETARLGAVAVLARGANPALGHVGFVVGATGDRIVLLGGNQGNAVTVAAFDRARLLALRWPAEAGSDQIPGPATVPAAVDDEAMFGPALAHVLTMEGGYSDDPYDPGGPTNFGITLKVYAAYTGRTLEATSRARLKDELRHPPRDRAGDLSRALLGSGRVRVARAWPRAVPLRCRRQSRCGNRDPLAAGGCACGGRR